MSTPVFAVDEIQTRAAIVADVDAGRGIITAKIAPYEVETLIDDGLSEIFTRGAFAAAVGNPSRIKVTNQGHQRQTVIGHAIELRDETDGIYGDLRIPDTTYGRDVLALADAGSLTDMSVEFRAQRRYMRVQRRERDVLVRHDRAVLLGVSPVGAGAYSDARIVSVREARQDADRERLIAELSALTSGPRP